MELSLDRPMRPSCYTDSKIVYYWITSTNKEWKQSVQNSSSYPEFTMQEDPSDSNFQVNPLLAADFTRRLRHFSKTLDQFWKRWRKKYLLELRECRRFGKWTQSPCDPIVIGDIVLVYDQDHPRTFWRLANVEDLIRGSDDKI